MSSRRRVVFVGGRYVTLHAYAVLARRRGEEIRQGRLELVVLSADDHHSFHGFTGEVLAGTLPLHVTRTPLAHAMPRATVIGATVTRVDPDRRVVTYTRVGAAGAGAVDTLRYDELVVGAGGREPVESVPGLAQHGLTLRGPGDMRRLLARLVALEHPSSRRMPSDIVVIGGGLAGVELAAALAGRPTTVSGRRVHLLHGGATLVPQLRTNQPGMAVRVEHELERLGVLVTCGVRATSVGHSHVALSDGRILPASVVLATTGQRPVRIPGLQSLPADDAGRLRTSCDLSVAPRIWAAGDAARVDHPRTGQPVPANALWAIKAGAHLGRNLSRTVAGKPSRPFRYLGLGQAASFGVGHGVAELYGIPLAGWSAWLTRLAFFLRFMPSRANAIEVVVTMTTRRDIVRRSSRVAPTGAGHARRGPASMSTRQSAVARVA